MPACRCPDTPRFAHPAKPAQIPQVYQIRPDRAIASAGTAVSRAVILHAATVFFLVLMVPSASGQDLAAGDRPTIARSPPLQTQWHTGDAWERALQRPVDTAWSRQELRKGLRNLAVSQRVAIFLSCRVSPNQLVDFSSSDQSLEETLRRLAESRGLGIGFVGPVIYMGRPAVADRLATTVEIVRRKVREVPSRQRTGLSQRNAVRWERLAQPRELVQRVNLRRQVDVTNLATIPYDLWPAYDLPALDYCEQMTLFLAGFDSSFELGANGTTCKITPMPSRLVIRRSYAAGKQAAAWATEIKRLLPTAETTRRANRLVVVGRWEDHRTIRKLLGIDPRHATDTPLESIRQRKRFQLTVKEQPVGSLLDHLAATMDLNVHYTAGSRPLVHKRVSVALKDATREQLFDTIAQEAGLTAEIKDATVWVDRVQLP